MSKIKWKILPCPFCGGEASIEECEGGMGARFSVGCSDDDGACMGYQSLTTFDRRADAVVAWNKRATPGAVAANKECLEFFAKHAPGISHLPGFENAWHAVQEVVASAESQS